MIKIYFINTWVLFLFSLAFNTSILQAQNSLTTSNKTNASYEFHYEDIANFREVLNIANQKGDTLQAIKQYFANGSDGLKAWVGRYGVKPERILKAVRYFPSYYNYLSTLDSVLMSYENQISKGLNGLKKLYPSEFVYIPPVYYFILFSGGGSVEMTANMISVDYFGLHDNLDKSEFDRIGGLFPEGPLALVNVEQIPQVAIHETAHLLQAYIQGELDYVSIYLEKEKSTILAYSIREGGADFLTYLAANIVDSVKWKYGEKYEKELWEAMEPILNDHVDDHKGWFSGKSEKHSDWPFQIGYYMGFKIVEYYYNTSDNKKDALTLILKSNQKEDFEKFITKYREKWN